MTWRQLSVVVERIKDAQGSSTTLSSEELFQPLANCFYTDVTTWNETTKKEWNEWLQMWSTRVLKNSNASLNDSVLKMRAVSPKYVPREWMLVDAYKHAEKGDYSLLKELEVLFRTPYDEQSLENENKYYKKTKIETYSGIGKGGTAYMS